jgi:hypothetical protein
MTILPGEGAREGKVIFEQASLFLSMDLISKKKYSDAIKMIDKSKEWPERLGVGKPYDVDTRDQEYLSAYCLDKLNRKSEADEFRKSVASYSGRRRAPAYGNLLTVKVLNEMGDKAAADEMMGKLADSKNPAQRWYVATVNNEQSVVAELEKQLENDTNFQIMKRLLEVTK